MTGGSESGGGWRKSSFSIDVHCVEVRFDDDKVHVRHSKDPAGRHALVFSRAEWLAFTNGVGVGEFDLPER